MRLLLVEDHESIVMGLMYLFGEEGFDCDVAASVSDAETLWRKSGGAAPCYDLIILDIALPDGNGYDLCRRIKRESDVPILFLTAKEEENDVVKGFDLGADDYICKPFRNRELISRIHNVLRRCGKKESKIRYRNLLLDTRECVVYRDGEPVSLTKLEYRIFAAMMNHPGKLFTRDEILESVWDAAGNFVNDNTLSVTMKRLREKLGDQDGAVIRTVRGMGYRIEKE